MSGATTVATEVRAALAEHMSEMMAENLLRGKCSVFGVNADDLRREHLPQIMPLVLGAAALFCGRDKAAQIRDRLLRIAEGGSNGKAVFDVGNGVKVGLRAVLKRTHAGEAAMRGGGIPMLTRNILVGIDGKRDVLQILQMYRGLTGIENALKAAISDGYVVGGEQAAGG